MATPIVQGVWAGPSRNVIDPNDPTQRSFSQASYAPALDYYGNPVDPTVNTKMPDQAAANTRMPGQVSYAPAATPPNTFSPTQLINGQIPVSSTLPAAPAQGYDPRYGGIPQVPNPIATQTAAIGGNIGNLGGLYGLAGPTNLFNQQQAALGLQTNLPGYQGMIGQSSANIGSMLQGQIPQDVRNQIAQSAAERGVSIGSVGSPNANTALLRGLGLTSLGLQQQGEQELTTAIGRTPQAPIFDPSKFFVTPEQQQAAQAAANLYGSAPIPSQAAAEARRQAGGVGGSPRPGGYQIVGGGGSPFGPVTPQGSAPGIVAAQGQGGNLTYGGISYPQGQTPQTAMDAWNKWYSGIQKNPYAPGTIGTESLPGLAGLTDEELSDFAPELMYGGGSMSAPGDWSNYGTVGAANPYGDFAPVSESDANYLLGDLG